MLPLRQILVSEQNKGVFAATMTPRRGIGRGRPEPNAVLLEEVRNLRARMETMETTQRRAPDDGVESSSEESDADVEAEEENENVKFIKMLEKFGSKPKMEIPMYEGSLNAEELMDWIRSIVSNRQRVQSYCCVKFWYRSQRKEYLQRRCHREGELVEEDQNQMQFY